MLPGAGAVGWHKTDHQVNTDQSDWQVDEEQPMPGQRFKQQAANGGSGNDAH